MPIELMRYINRSVVKHGRINCQNSEQNTKILNDTTCVFCFFIRKASSCDTRAASFRSRSRSELGRSQQDVRAKDASHATTEPEIFVARGPQGRLIHNNIRLYRVSVLLVYSSLCALIFSVAVFHVRVCVSELSSLM